MTSNDAHETSGAGLAGLRQLPPDPGRAERVRARCRTRLGRRRRRTERPAVFGGLRSRPLAVLALGGFGVLYAIVLVSTALRLEELLR